eukprot:2931579-Amphidinium_carterae.2
MKVLKIGHWACAPPCPSNTPNAVCPLQLREPKGKPWSAVFAPFETLSKSFTACVEQHYQTFMTKLMSGATFAFQASLGTELIAKCLSSNTVS